MHMNSIVHSYYTDVTSYLLIFAIFLGKVHVYQLTRQFTINVFAIEYCYCQLSLKPKHTHIHRYRQWNNNVRIIEINAVFFE
jgi:hypothetical protein